MSDGLNVLVVVLDSVRADHLSCYGYARETTPFLDDVAREGVRFSNMIATAPWTLPAHAALFTGTHSVTHGANDENRFLSARNKSLPQYLKAAGYRTAAFCTTPWVSPDTGFGRGFDAFFTQRYQNRLAARAASYGRRASDALLRRGDAGARRTNHALKRWLGSSTQPFCAFVHYSETHLRIDPPPPYNRLFLPNGVHGGRVRSVNRDGGKYLTGGVEMNEEDFTILTALHDGALRYLDHRVREIADILRERGEWERTLCIVTADHGENLGEHGMLGHRFGLHDTLLCVPLLLRCPPCVPQGFVVEEFAQTSDVLPTILRTLGIEDDTGRVQGRALLDEARVTAGPPFAIAERFRPNLEMFQQRFPAFDTRPFDVRLKAIRTKREKFVWHSDEANELYDLVADPGETTNLIERETERADVLRRQLFDWFATVQKYEAEDDAPALDDRMRQQLQALGYVD